MSPRILVIECLAECSSRLIYMFFSIKWKPDFKRLYKYFTPHCRYGYYPVMIFVPPCFARTHKYSRPIINLFAGSLDNLYRKKSYCYFCYKFFFSFTLHLTTFVIFLQTVGFLLFPSSLQKVSLHEVSSLWSLQYKRLTTIHPVVLTYLIVHEE